jgi:transposase
MLTDRREALTRRRMQTVNRLQSLLAEPLPGQATRDITALQAKKILASVRPRDIAGKTRRRIAAEERSELTTIDTKDQGANAELKALVLARGSRLMDLPGVGPVVAARILAVGDITRAEPTPALPGREPADEPHDPHRRGHPAPAQRPRPLLLPPQASSPQKADGSHALPQPTELRRDLPPTPRRRRPRSRCGSGRALRASQESSAVDLPPHIDTSDQPLPGPADATLPPRTQQTERASEIQYQPAVDNRREPVGRMIIELTNIAVTIGATNYGSCAAPDCLTVEARPTSPPWQQLERSRCAAASLRARDTQVTNRFPFEVTVPAA